jgi:hypothetical protein
MSPVTVLTTPDEPATPRESWGESASAAFQDIIDAAPTLAGSDLTALYYAVDLLNAADVMQAQADKEGLVVEGSQGQPVAHPLLSEVRLSRAAALSAIRALGLSERSAASAAGAALVGKRWANRAAAGGSAARGQTPRGDV